MKKNKTILFTHYYGICAGIFWTIVTAIVPTISLYYLVFVTEKNNKAMPIQIPIAALVIGSIAFWVIHRYVFIKPVKILSSDNGIELKYLFKQQLILWDMVDSIDYSLERFSYSSDTGVKTESNWMVKVDYIDQVKRNMKFSVSSEEKAIEMCLFLEETKDNIKL